MLILEFLFLIRVEKVFTDTVAKIKLNQTHQTLEEVLIKVELKLKNFGVV
jgi:hypothetical protein